MRKSQVFFDPLSNERKSGRPTLSDGELLGRRDRLVWYLSVNWGEIGYDFRKVSSREELYEALSPLRGRSGEDVLAIFVHRTSALLGSEKTGKEIGKEIRALGKQLATAVDAMQASYQEQAECARSLQVAEAAVKMKQVKDAGTELDLDPRLNEEHRNVIVSEFRKRQNNFNVANSAYEDASKTERNLRGELKDMEAAFAQDQLLDYIAEAQYARNPLSMANALAGLPEMTWPQSYARCSKINCSGWPTIWYSEYEFIEGVWKLRTSIPEMSIVELFKIEIQKLPKKSFQYYAPQAKEILLPNQLRSRLADNFRMLRLAIEATSEAKLHPARVPFRIAFLFERNIEKPRGADDVLLIAHERLE